VTKAHADAAHDLQALIQSRHPIITIDTVEEERVDNLLGIVASGLHMPLFTWTVTHGLQRAGGENVVYGCTPTPGSIDIQPGCAGGRQ